MATGYTWTIKDGSNTSVRQYLLDVSHAFGFSGMYDKPTSTPIKVREIDTQVQWRQNQVAEALELLAELRAMSYDDVVAAEAEERVQRTKDRAERRSLARDTRERYDEMIVAVTEWKVDPLVQMVKDYALSQLKDSKANDCDWLSDPKSYYNQPVARKDPAAWRQEKINLALEDIKRHEKEIAVTKSNIAQSNMMIEALLGCLPDG